MPESVIRVESLSKRYHLHHQNQEKYTALRDVMANGAKQLGKKLLSPFRLNTSQALNLQGTGSDEDFYALEDVSFEIKQGDRVGIIGRNGAGKSTLLKILSRITEPTSGRIEITGRVASLLEVGTGFHPELTGRENVFLNGAILGMDRDEIKRKFDEIVDFAEVERFLDTPVKRYSSGMYVRLAFAVAAHLEPEILIVDEVLAVGDAQFQKKCLGRMKEVGREGRTVLFVSHNMAAIEALCKTSILMSAGRLVSNGLTADTVLNYIKLGRENILNKDLSCENSEMKFGLKSFRICNCSGEEISEVSVGEEYLLEFVINTQITYKSARFIVGINRYIDNYRLVIFDTELVGNALDLNEGVSKVMCKIQGMNFVPGKYILTVRAEFNGKVLFYVPSITEFDVIESAFYGSSKMPDKSWGGVVMLKHEWYKS